MHHFLLQRISRLRLIFTCTVAFCIVFLFYYNQTVNNSVNSDLIYLKNSLNFDKANNNKVLWKQDMQGINCKTNQVINLTKEGLLTAVSTGRLGNQMFLYATLYAISKQRNRTAFISPHMSSFLSRYFKVSICPMAPEIYQNLSWSDMYLYNHINLSYTSLTNMTPSNVRFTGFAESWKYFGDYISEMKHEFKFRDEISVTVKIKMDKLIPPLEFPRKTTTIVGIHVRRKDYIKFAKIKHLELPTMEFYAGAMKYFKDKYDKTVFIVASDDIQWCIKKFKNLPNFSENELKFLNGTSLKDGGYDLAVLANCDHVIFGVGTFGFWGGYLSGGEVAFCSDCIQPTYTFMENLRDYGNFVLPTWKGFNRKGKPSSTLAKWNPTNGTMIPSSSKSNVNNKHGEKLRSASGLK